MEKPNKIKVSLDELYPLIQEQLEIGGTVQLPITGTSMLPLLVWGRDSVEIVKCDSPDKSDIIFYRRDDGHFVLHRIVGKNKNGYILCGDNQWQKEYGIRSRHIIARVSSITRKGKKFKVSSPLYRLYSLIWTNIIPLRKFILIPSRKLKRLFR